jgi:hypothetical protein
MLKKISERLRLKDGVARQWTERMGVCNQGGQGCQRAIEPKIK